MLDAQLTAPGIYPGACCGAGPENPPWFGIHVRSRCEFRAYDELCWRGFEAFLPLRRIKRRWSDRLKTIDVPIFPGYLFCRFDLSARFRVLNASGVGQIVGAGSTPIAISDTEVRSIQTLVASKAVLTPWPYLQVGQRVWIDHGPLTGVEGFVTRAENGKPRVVVSVTLLRRAIAAEIERDWIGRVE